MAESRLSGIPGLKPPEPLHKLTAEEYKKFKNRFEVYRIAAGANNMESEVQVALLLHVMGPQCQDIFQTFEFPKDEAKNYVAVVKKFDEHFIPLKNESVSSHVFFTRDQRRGETFDDYVTELRKLAKECEFGTLNDRMIRDRIVTGIGDSRLQDRLLRESDLTLTKAINICKAAELATERIREIEEKGERVDRIQRTTTSRDTKTTNTEENSGPSTSTGQNRTFFNRPKIMCQNCGYNHQIRNCPAYGKQCLKCKKMGHFARMCKSGFSRNNIRLVNREEWEDRLQRSCEEEEETVLNSVFINHISGSKDWSQPVKFIDVEKEINFKLDTGAQCNVLPKHLCHILGINRFEKSKMKLSTYSGESIKTAGQVTLQCQIGQTTKFINFQICEGNFVPILGLSTLENFNLVQRVYVSVVNTVESLTTQYKEVFEGLGKIKNQKYKITLKDDWKGKVEPSRHVPFKLLQKLKIELSNLEKSGVISKIDKPTDFVSSLVIVMKPDATIRVCLDPQYLNSQIKREQIQIPTLQELTSRLHGSKMFTTLDASKAFFMLPLDDESKELTTFNTPFGRYHYNRLPFGLSSSPEVFHRIYSDVFKDIKGVETYIDDILIHSETEQEHKEILEKVLQRAQEAGIKFNKNKCNFMKSEVRFLGHMLTEKGIKLDENRVKAILDMKEPETQKELLRFLGMINYISRFIPNFSELSAPLRELTKKDIPFVWASRQKQAYDLIKRKISEPPVLAYFCLDKKITLSVDASKNGLGAVILQNGQPVAYGSRAMTGTEKLYSQIEKESLAILYGCTKFHQYLYGHVFTVETDHKPLVSIFAKPLNKSPTRLQRIRLALQPYTFEIKYKPGKELLVADHLSRSYLDDDSKSYNIDIEAHVAMIINGYNITDQKLQELIEETSKDRELISVIKYVREGWPENKDRVSSEAKIFYNYRDELGECQGLLMKGNQIVIPQKKRKEVLEKVHYAHLGTEKCKQLARKTLFWPNMSKEIEDLVTNCDACKSFQNQNRKEPMIEKEIPYKAWQILSTDIFFLYRVPHIITVDAYSKFVEIKKLDNLSAGCVIDNLKEIFSVHGIPNILYSDSGTQYTCQDFKNFSAGWNFEHKIVSPKHHQGNGLAERYIQTVKRTLKKLIYDQKDIYLGLLIYRNTPILGNGKTPTELLFNRNVRTIIPSFTYNNSSATINEEKMYRQELEKRQKNQKIYYDQGSRKLSDLEKGDVVKIQDETNKKPLSSGIIIGNGVGPRSYQIKTENGNIITRNRKMIIKGGKFKERVLVYDDLTDRNQKIEEDVLNRSERVEDNLNLEGSQMVQENRDLVGQTRSGRLIKKPSYLNDYYLN
ncbi:uncharacterized protein K02A2.6-like [Pectinophora gossypiella]|uniref:uncharacterized protein K02A2.6-like n=1 Tax=Pectinophora gossypiella TaxID=13191 RepID=UPI00214E6859|nr:uncharacterized protein K02A2.6-like [Pectinophora gossypiella]